ncbi:MAG TPA: hypothetical protein VHS78_04305 [Candidatus Elarobacter sp.]|nr:hypothetical protein [Candidatus Elarobacter sp.]
MNTPFSIGASYEYAIPTNGCGDPASHLAPPCGKLKAPALNPDDSLPGFKINALYEAYLQYKDERLGIKLGDQVFNTLWTSPSDTRIKPTAFQGVDVNYSATPALSFELADMTRFQGRVNSTFDKETLLTSFPAGTAGTPANTFVPGGTSLPTAGLTYAKIAYNGTHGLVSSLHLYHFSDIANLIWNESKFTFMDQRTKPWVAFHGGIEHQTGAAVIGKIYSTPYGLQLGGNVTRNVTLTGSYERIPARSDTIRLPAGVSCNAKQALVIAKGVTFPYLIPVNAPECITNANGATTIFYGGFASPYTDAYGTDPLWLTSLTQSPIDRHAPFSGPKIQATWTSNDKRLIVYVTQSYLDYGNAIKSQQLSEVNADATYYAAKVGPGPYKGLMLRYRYGSRQVTNVVTYGGLPQFRYNRAQLEFDF